MLLRTCAAPTVARRATIDQRKVDKLAQGLAQRHR
jgi:hypothetical protein